ncbi:hypothetical protein ACRALDRAFT_2026072 [Sodiomyces alcalophilus JCM 7366]|uniref:uncharacterized protein n=1 Tax=Sodiomyces alcalophilus JCM 7366 TaxID=591952 RepID=UPI0039B4D765
MESPARSRQIQPRRRLMSPTTHLFFVSALAAFLASSPLTAPALAAAQSTGSDNNDERACYMFDGTVASNEVQPCGGTTGHSACCHSGWACLSNGLCMAAGGDPDNLADATIYRVGCTDRSWGSLNCPRWCTDADEIDNVAEPQPIRACMGFRDLFYCINEDEDGDCEPGDDEAFQLPGTATIVKIIGEESTETSASATGTSTSGRPASGTETSTSATGTTGASNEPSAESGDGDQEGDGGPSTALQVGLGVGIGVGGLGILLALVFFLLWRRKSRKAKEAAEKTKEGEDSEKKAPALGPDGSAAWGPSPLSPHGSELPATTMSRNLHEASPDAMLHEAPGGDTTLGRVEAPSNERRHEMAAMEGIQGLHELPGDNVMIPSANAAVSGPDSGGPREPGT